MQSGDNKCVLELSEQVQANVETWGVKRKEGELRASCSSACLVRARWLCGFPKLPSTLSPEQQKLSMISRAG